jgi:hypothetical protein
MSKSRALIGVLASLVATTASAQVYRIETGEYSYLPSGWVQIEECLDYQQGCSFDLSGVLTPDVRDQGPTLSLPFSDLMLVGDVAPGEYPNLESSPVTAPQVSELLATFQLPLVSSDGDTRVFGEQLGASFLEITLNDHSLSIKGGRDHRPVDGDGFHFELFASRTWYGDANLDGEFNSGDIIEVFSAGVYEDQIDHNAHWWTGDWNGDSEFNSSDLVIAMQEGGYELGPRATAVVVPEPAAGMLLLGVCGAVFSRRR